MDGTIGAESAPGEGSTFWFEVELRSAAPTISRRTSRTRASAPIESSNQRRVLVAEDSMINQVVAVRLLERYGVHARVVGDGREALAALAEEDFDAVLMDCQMPVLDGYEATAELRRREGDGRRTPVIAMTANAMKGDRERCVAAGMDDYITKPMRSHEVAAILERWLPVRAEERRGAVRNPGDGTDGPARRTALGISPVAGRPRRGVADPTTRPTTSRDRAPRRQPASRERKDLVRRADARAAVDADLALDRGRRATRSDARAPLAARNAPSSSRFSPVGALSAPGMWPARASTASSSPR